MVEDDALTVDGVEVRIHKISDGTFTVRLAASGEELGRLKTSQTAGHFEAHTPDGIVLQMPSRWSGTVNAVFGTRALAVRALLKAQKES